ncbi:unnamed protein product [Thelazia callipaeda]|uniref:BHLH domain-containing protein n=1 Tax=Thelazia callipaeda TaxID=103827 RepID=A0A0N5CQ37_THECL|nr:unnamed protein product [Thelazia callipaeda]
MASNAFLNMLGDFASINRSPDFNSKSSNDHSKSTRAQVGRQHSLSLAVGVADEPGLFTVDKELSTRRQTMASVNCDAKKSRIDRRLSAPPSLKAGLKRLHMKLENLHEAILARNGTVKEQKSHQQIPSEVHSRSISPCPVFQESSSSYSSSADHSKAMQTIIISNMGHRGSVVVIDDD